MKNISELLYGKESSDKMDLFNERIKDLDHKYEEVLNGNSIESKFFIDWTAGQDMNRLVITDDELNTNVVADIKAIFNSIFK